MALLEDPTIQRILDEVNKAASGGALGAAGSYISKPTESLTPFESQLLPPDNDFFNQDQLPPLFYPTPDMFNMDSLANFESNADLNSMPSIVPITKSSNFDYYSSGLYNTMPKNFLSPFEHYNGVTKLNIKHPIINDSPTRRASNVSSTNNDILLENQQQPQQSQPSTQSQSQQQDYHSIPSTMTTNIPNLGLNIRNTSHVDAIPFDALNSNGIELTSSSITNEIKNSSTSRLNVLSDHDDVHVLPLNNNQANNESDLDNSNSAGQIFYDPNPQIIQRKGSHSVTYKQNIIVRYLQPPPISNPGPLIIKEVRAPQPSPLPPLVIKQRPTPPKTPPPLIIREKPPPLPSTLATKVITRPLPPEPAPPRAVIIERLPPLPPKPRDIIIERWLPYEVLNQKRKVIVQRAPKVTKEHPSPKNIIITYEPVQAKIVRNFQKQNISREDPQTYAKRYGPQLYDPTIVIQHARAAGVIEDLNPPATFTPAMTNSVGTGTDSEMPPAMITTDEHQLGKNQINHNEKPEESSKRKEEENVVEHEKTIPPSSKSPVLANDNAQEEEILVEENVTPFYMNSGEDLQQTLHRLGIDLLKGVKHDNNC